MDEIKPFSADISTGDEESENEVSHNISDQSQIKTFSDGISINRELTIKE